MKRTAAVVCLLGALAASPCALADDADSYTIDSRHTFPQYEVVHMGTSVQRGRFDRTEGKLAYDSAAHKGAVEISIDAASVSTGLAKLDERLRGEDWLDAAAFPKITFKSSDFVFDGDKLAKVNGELTLRGVTRPVTLEADFFHCGVNALLLHTVCGADFTARIKRSDFGMKSILGLVSDDVLLRVNVEAIADRK